MKRLVLLGEGHGEVSALPILVRRLLKEKRPDVLFVDKEVIREKPDRLVRWDKTNQKPDLSEWVKRICLAARRREVGAILAVYDGDAKKFPAGSENNFCAAKAARMMAEAAAVEAEAGKRYSLSVVFACSEFESWLVAGAKSLAGRESSDGRVIVPSRVVIPSGQDESRGKSWLQQNCIHYRPARDQSTLAEMVDIELVRTKNLRSFVRIEHSLDELVDAVSKERHISTPR